MNRTKVPFSCIASQPHSSASFMLPAYSAGLPLSLNRNGPFLFGDKGTSAEYAAGLARAIERGWLTMHESGTFVRFTSAGAELFA